MTELQKKLLEAIDSSRSDRLTHLTESLLSIQREDEAVRSHGGGAWQHFEAYRPGVSQYKRINHVQNRLRLLVANTRTTDLVPTFTNVEADVVATARRSWWEWRAQGKDGFGGWKTDFDNAFADFAAVGEGHLRVGIVEDSEGAAVTVKHYHPLNVLLDPFAKYANESRWICYSDVYSAKEAKLRFPKIDWESLASATYSLNGIQSHGFRIVEYFCKESESDGLPGYAAFVNGLEGTLIDEGENPFGDLIPHQTFLGFIPSGSDVPIGIVQACMYVQHELERMEDDARKKSERDNLFGIMPEIFHEDDWRAYSNGARPAYLRLNEDKLRLLQDVNGSVLTIPRNGENEDQKQRRAEFMAMLQQLSGVSSMDMGQISSGGVTAREVSEVASRSASAVGFLAREFARGIQELAVKVGTVARSFDTKPFCVTEDGLPVWFNRDDKRLSSKELWKGSLSCVIGDEDLIKTDVNAKKDRDAAMWMAIYQATQNVNALRQALVVQGVKNPEDYLPAAPAPGPAIPMPGS